MIASLRAFLTALILAGVLGSMTIQLPASFSLLSATTAAILVAFPIIWIVLDAAGPLEGRFVSAAAHLGGWLLAPVYGSSGQLLFALPATLLWPIGNLFEVPLLTGNIWNWAARTFLSALVVVLYWAAELALSQRVRKAAAGADAFAAPPAWPTAPAAPVRRTPFRAGPTPNEQAILRRLDALESALAHLSDQTSEKAASCASQDRRATVQPLQAVELEAPAGPEEVGQGEEASDAEVRGPAMPRRPREGPGGTNILDLFHR